MKRSIRYGSNAAADLPQQRPKGTWPLKRIDSVVRSILERVRPTEYRTLGGSRRFRAAQRRAATAVAVPDLAIQSAGYLLILPGLVALLLPWRTRTHLAWLVAFLVVAVGYLALNLNDALTPHLRGDLVTVLAVACGASLAGHELFVRAQLRAFAQIEHIRALHRQGDAHIARLTQTHSTMRTLEATAQQFEQQALYDALTGLANRTLLGDRLAHALAQRGTTVAFVMLDLDDFKAVNDSLGHAAGDEVLMAVAERFMSVLRSGDTLARLGGDEFAVVAPGTKDAAVACAIAGRLLGSLRAPFRLALLGGQGSRCTRARGSPSRRPAGSKPRSSCTGQTSRSTVPRRRARTSGISLRRHDSAAGVSARFAWNVVTSARALSSRWSSSGAPSCISEHRAHGRRPHGAHPS